MKQLTKSEEQVMQILWDMGKGLAKDIRAKFEEPLPAITTVSTIIRILEDKGFVGHKAYGKTHEYYPLVAKADYTKSLMGGIVSKYFDNSLHQMVSFFSSNKDLTVSELEDLRSLIDGELEKKLEGKKEKRG